MLLSRRSFIYCSVLTVIVWFLWHTYSRERLHRDANFPDASVTQPPSKSEEAFDWAKLHVHYPISSVEPLPKPQRNRLPRVQYQFSTEAHSATELRELRQSEVKRIFQRCWNSYREHAWLQDELAPISGKAKSTFGGWAATLVDSLDTLWIMDLKQEFAEAVDATIMIDFTKVSSDEVNLFETTIRYLGGLISAYDLSGDARLLSKALELAHMIYAAFDTPNRMPITRWKLQLAAKGEAQVADENVLLAEIGSLSLEFTRLSQITKDPRWYDAIHRIMKVFDEQQDQTNLPGMWPLSVNAATGDFKSGNVFTLGAMCDSLYEYFPKMYALLGGSDMYERLYKRSMDAAIRYTLFRPMLPDHADILVAGVAHSEYPGQSELEPSGQHLGCFTGGMLALGGQLMRNFTHVELGRKVTDGCVWTYENSQLGIMSESFTMLPCQSNACEWDESAWLHQVRELAGEDLSDVYSYVRQRNIPKGYTSMNDRRYILRPEAIESVFILYRVTGDPRLQETAWTMLGNINRHTQTELANAAIVDVNNPMAPKDDSMESFWTAETLKYFYLIFSQPSLISLDDYVFNTEAHPLRRPESKSKWWPLNG